MPVECLVRQQDGPGGRKSGDIITVKEVPCTWGSGEGLPTYVIIEISNINKNQFAAYDQRHYDTGEVDGVGNPISIRSLYRFDLPNLPGYTGISQKVTVTKKQTEDNLIDRRLE